MILLDADVLLLDIRYPEMSVLPLTNGCCEHCKNAIWSEVLRCTHCWK